MTTMLGRLGGSLGRTSVCGLADMVAGRAVLAVLLTCGILAAPVTAAVASELRVVATIRPIHSIVAAVAGEDARVDLLVEGAASPHSFALKPSDARALADADIFVRVSEGVEPFTRRLVQSLPKDVQVVTVADAAGMLLLPVRESARFEKHRHDHDGSGHGHGHGHKHHHGAGHEGQQVDGHLWLDPENAKVIARHVADVIADRLQSAGNAAAGERVRANAARFARDLDEVSIVIRSKLEPVGSSPFIVFHDAYQYFEKRFGVAAVAAIMVNPEVPPGARRLSEVRAVIRETNAACVFAEPQFRDRVVEALIAGTGVRAGMLDPLGVRHEPGPMLYGAMLRDIGDGLVSCLGKAAAALKE